MAEIIKSITELPVAEIVVRNRLRPVSPAGVASIRASIREIGHIKDPIDVRKVKHRGGEYVLMDGAHRLAAYIEEGREMIPVKVYTCNDDFATLVEIDGNLAGAELNPLDTAVFLAQRKRLYEKLHPETKQGGARGNQHTGGWQTDTMSFCQVTAEKFGLSERHVRRLVASGERLDPRDVQLLRKAPRAVSLKDLIEISKIEETTERYDVVEALSKGTAKSASAARKARASDGDAPSPLSANDKALKALTDAWARAPKSVRRRFLEAHVDQIVEELEDLRDDPEGDDD